jgi:hypothetical protein
MIELFVAIPLCLAGLSFLLMPLWQQLATPMLRATTRRRYLSRFLFTVTHGGKAAVHLGSSFDLLWKLRGATVRQIAREIRAGLDRMAGEMPPDAQLTVATWFLSQRKMRRLGFTEEPATWSEKVEAAGGYLEILFQQWLIQRRVRLFNPLAIRRYVISAGNLAAALQPAGCNPHSVLAKPDQRPARGSSPSFTGRVQYVQPMLGYPRSCSGL